MSCWIRIFNESSDGEQLLNVVDKKAGYLGLPLHGVGQQHTSNLRDVFPYLP